VGRRFAHCFLALMNERPAIMLAYRWSIQSMSWTVEGGLCDEMVCTNNRQGRAVISAEAMQQNVYARLALRHV